VAGSRVHKWSSGWSCVSLNGELNDELNDELNTELDDDRTAHA
jgi:hypothetical protein